MSARQDRSALRVMVVGLDGGTLDVFRPLMDAGVMPNLATLVRRSACGPLASTDPYITPTAWTTFLTGCDPWRHGIFDYRYFDPDERQIRLHHAGHVQLPTLFDVVARSGGDVVSLNLPMTYPPRQEAVEPSTSQGARLIVGGLDSPSTQATLAPYPQFAERLHQEGVRLDIDPVWRRRPRSEAEFVHGCQRSAASFAARADAAEIADSMTDWRLMVVQFQVLDSFQHFCWSYLGLDGPLADDRADERPEWIQRAREVMASLDVALGRLLELASRRGAAVVALSDHGFGPFREQVSLPELFRQRGLLAKAPATDHLRFTAACLGRNLRKWLYRRAHAGSTAGIAWSLHSIFPCNWKRTRVVALHGNLAGLVYANTPERFGTGPVRGSFAREQTLADATAALLEARHPRTGEPLFERVLRTDERLADDALRRKAPDLVAIPSAGFHTRTRLDAAGKLLRREPELSGTHRRSGVLFVDAPGVRRGEFSADLRDVAPTILQRLGLPAPALCDGRPRQEMFADAGAAPMAAAPGLAPAAMAGYQDRESAEIEARLRALGYMD